jgi:hypothetical protein
MIRMFECVVQVALTPTEFVQPKLKIIRRV